MTMLSHQLRVFLPLLAVAALFTACGGNDAADTSAADSTRDTSAMTQPPVDPSAIGPDTTDGTLSISGSGTFTGTWQFKDVTAFIEERASGGTTQAILSLEAHESLAPERHFRIRLLREGGEIEKGRYTIDDRENRLEGRFEQEGSTFRSITGSSGWVELTALEGDRAAGRFELNLPMLGNESSMQQLKGNFNQRLQR